MTGSHQNNKKKKKIPPPKEEKAITITTEKIKLLKQMVIKE